MTPDADSAQQAAPLKLVMPTAAVARATGDSVANNGLSQGIARLTFTSGSKTVSGFTPTHEGEEPFKVSGGGATPRTTTDKSHGTAENKAVAGLRAATPDVTKTPSRSASAVDLVKKGAAGESAVETPTMVRNMSTADLTRSEVKLAK